MIAFFIGVITDSAKKDNNASNVIRTIKTLYGYLKSEQLVDEETLNLMLKIQINTPELFGLAKIYGQQKFNILFETLIDNLPAPDLNNPKHH